MGVKQKTISLKRSGKSLSDPLFQLDVLHDKSEIDLVPFKENLPGSVKPNTIDIFQINLGKLCNQSCAHCHVDAGPDRKEENMDRQTLEKCLDIILENEISTVDLTGGAPEMNPNFRWFVSTCSSYNVNVIVRSNLTILVAHRQYADLPEFFKEYNVRVISSLPYFSARRTDNQRGEGVFNDSIKALKKLNAVGYGTEDSPLILDLVYNPNGAFLPGSQSSLEKEFKMQLKRKFNIAFNNLFCITNMPVSRFLDYLMESGNYKSYMRKLVDAFNPAAVDGLMCRNTLSISWDGFIYDCDFNQMLDLKVNSTSDHIDNFSADKLMRRSIRTANHCYGCTAGAGSSCGGEIT